MTNQTKPQPLDLEKWNEEIIADRIRELVSEMFPEKVNEEIIKEIIELEKETFRDIKEDIKSACEFYLRYKDNPELLIKEHPEYKSEIGTLRYLEFKEELNFEEEYNEWLFKLAFKDVLEEEQNDSRR